MSGINPLSPNSIPLPPQPGLGTSGATQSTTGASFKDTLLRSIEQVNTMQQDADQAVESLMTGGDVTTAEVMTAVQKADLAFRMMMQVRNKLMQAYDEVKQVRV